MVNETPPYVRLDIAERTRKVELLEAMIRDFTSTAAHLAGEIAAEEKRTRIKDPNHVAYSTLAKALATRRGKLLMSVADAEMRLLAARHELGEATVIASREDRRRGLIDGVWSGERERGNDQSTHASAA